jgi:acetyl-CoA carboxylase carboxyl transferase subunit alpha
MLQYATYFVISPEGCANIIWKSSEFAPDAAAAMGVTSSKLEELGIVDATIPEPLGGAHRDPIEMASRLKAHLMDQVDRLSAMDTDALLEARYRRLMSYGN